MGAVTKKPLQIYLRQEQLDALRALAQRSQLSMAELVRQAVDRLLEETPIEDDPLWSIVGIGNSGIGDLAAEHDRYLEELERGHNQQ